MSESKRRRLEARRRILLELTAIEVERLFDLYPLSGDEDRYHPKRNLRALCLKLRRVSRERRDLTKGASV